MTKSEQKWLMTSKELLERRFYYRGQLRRHDNRRRNADLAEFWRAHVAAEIRAGSTQKAARALATRAASDEFGISTSQVSRARTDAATYLMDASELKRRMDELQQLADDLRHSRVPPSEHVASYRRYLKRLIQQGKAPSDAHKGAVKSAAGVGDITPGQMRRILRAFNVMPHRKK